MESPIEIPPPPSDPTPADAAFSHRPPHPIVYTLLFAPFGAVYGFVAVALAYVASANGMSVDNTALLVATVVFPHVWKFFWSPIVDTTLTRKTWYMIAVSLCSCGILAMSVMPLTTENLFPLQAIIFVSSLAVTFLGMSVEGLVAHATPPEQRGRVGGWLQAGNLGGSGLGGGAGLFMASHLPALWMSGAVIALIFMCCASMLIFVPEAPAHHKFTDPIGIITEVAKDLWLTFKSRTGMLCAALCFLPMSTAAAQNVLNQAEVADKWHVNADTVALISGTLNGLISVVGCLVGGELCARLSPRRVYAFSGLLLATIAASMAVAPFKPWAYEFFLLAYAFASGIAYASFTGFVLQAIGKGAAATKYNAFASLSNAPITYMGLILAHVFAAHSNANTMLFTESLVSISSLFLLMLIYYALRPRPAIPQPA